MGVSFLFWVRVVGRCGIDKAIVGSEGVFALSHDTLSVIAQAVMRCHDGHTCFASSALFATCQQCPGIS